MAGPAASRAPRAKIALRGKYAITAALLAGRAGTLLDVGARDRTLARHLGEGKLVYRSADKAGAHDHAIDLERPLPFADGAFDVVVALDCLEHVERLHAALAELIRVSRGTTVIALPNLACWQHRLSFLRHGRLATDKYDLGPVAPADRHRWLTVLPQTDDCVRANVPATHRLARVVHETAGGRAARVAAFAALRAGLPLSRALVARSIYLIEALPRPVARAACGAV
jgi:SAM-dependent methyltransferase